MKILELFAGTRSIGKAFEAKGHEVYSIEWNKEFENINWNVDIGQITAKDIIDRFGKPDVIWASPDCTSYSIAAISHHRIKEEDGNLAPKSEYAKFCDEVNKNVLKLIRDLNPKYFFIENPRGMLRTMGWMKPYKRHTVTYCQYGNPIQKPTDIWTNHPAPCFKKPCKAGDPCHMSSPSSSNRAIKSLPDAYTRSIIPKTLCEHIVSICEQKTTIPTLRQELLVEV
jgi:hypothetical protein